MFKLLLIFASLWYLVISPQCFQSKCMPDTTENKDKCQIQYQNPFYYEVRKCPKGLSCSKTDGNTVYCEKKYNDEESCSTGDECFSGVCENNICKGKSVGQNCLFQQEMLKKFILSKYLSRIQKSWSRVFIFN